MKVRARKGGNENLNSTKDSILTPTNALSLARLSLLKGLVTYIWNTEQGNNNDVSWIASSTSTSHEYTERVLSHTCKLLDDGMRSLVFGRNQPLLPLGRVSILSELAGRSDRLINMQYREWMVDRPCPVLGALQPGRESGLLSKPFLRGGKVDCYLNPFSRSM